MVALIQAEVVTSHGWMTQQEFTDLVAVSQMTPGPIGINSATYAGYTAVINAGYPTWAAVGGSLLASFAVVLLPVLLVLLVGQWLLVHRSQPTVTLVLKALRLAVVGLIAAAALSLATADTFGQPALNLQFLLSVAIFLTVFVLNYRFRVSPILLIVLAAVVGAFVYL